MADTSTFPTIHQALHSGDNILNMKAGGTISTGMVVAIAATGVDFTVIAALQNTGHPVGVALNDAVDGGLVAVATIGCVCWVCEGAGAAVDAGDYVMVDDCAVGGTVTVYDPGVVAHAATLAAPGASGHTFGLALEDIAANSTGRVLIIPTPSQTSVS